MSQTNAKIADDINALRFNVARSIRYHDKRRGYFDFLGKFLQYISLLGSSAAVATLIGATMPEFEFIGITIKVPLLISALTACVTLLNLMIGCAGKMENHTKLRNQFHDLMNSIDDVSDATIEDMRKLNRWRVDIEKEEPSISDWLNKLMFNETVDALGYDPCERKPVFFYYYLGNLRPY